ncbi:hypothetical protein [Salinisphaera sp.]|uniref:hypothetical protein n=1 Tax=Salinisphaera sp. TaxID=1914330 RepID=UPI002D770623|nr:hypothetical protein [Salinisphaera sp.]HET7314399.1 hypothetical protein [Salinisphaera sp.]
MRAFDDTAAPGIANPSPADASVGERPAVHCYRPWRPWEIRRGGWRLVLGAVGLIVLAGVLTLLRIGERPEAHATR